MRRPLPARLLCDSWAPRRLTIDGKAKSRITSSESFVIWKGYRRWSPKISLTQSPPKRTDFIQIEMRKFTQTHTINLLDGGPSEDVVRAHCEHQCDSSPHGETRSAQQADAVTLAPLVAVSTIIRTFGCSGGLVAWCCGKTTTDAHNTHTAHTTRQMLRDNPSEPQRLIKEVANPGGSLEH